MNARGSIRNAFLLANQACVSYVDVPISLSFLEKLQNSVNDDYVSFAEAEVFPFKPQPAWEITRETTPIELFFEGLICAKYKFVLLDGREISGKVNFPLIRTEKAAAEFKAEIKRAQSSL